MITGNKERKIESYLFIDRCAEGAGFTYPEDGEEIIGIPYRWEAENSAPFIEHRKDGFVTQTVNCADIAIINFQREPDNG